MSLKQRVGARVREIRQRRKLTQEALAEQTDRSVDGISALERGLVLPGFETLERLANVLGVPLAEFFDPTIEGEGQQRAALRARLAALVSELSDDQLEIAVGQVAVLVEAAKKPRRTNGR